MIKGNKTILFANKKAEGTWGKYLIGCAWKELGKYQTMDELRYTNALFCFNKFGSVLWKADKSNDWGRSIKDLFYGFWTEEDIRLRLAAELCKFKNCQVHGQIHIHGTKNQKNRYYRPKGFHIHKYPDILFMKIKEREMAGYTKDGCIESSAIEIKYFSPGENEGYILASISSDLDKLVEYQKKRLSPRIDSGFFFCIDESNKAEKILAKLFKKEKYKSVALGYGIIIPRYVLSGVPFLKQIEDEEGFERRKIAYLAYYVRGKIWGISSYRKLPWDGGAYYFYRSSDWLAFVWPKYFTRGLIRKKNIGVVIGLYGEKKNKLKKFKRVVDIGRYVESEMNTSRAIIYSFNRDRLGSLSEIEALGDKIVKVVKKLI